MPLKDKSKFDNWFAELPRWVEIRILDFLLSSGEQEWSGGIRNRVPYAKSSALERLVERGFVSVRSEKAAADDLIRIAISDFAYEYYRITPRGKKLIRAWDEAEPALRKVAKIFKGRA